MNTENAVPGQTPHKGMSKGCLVGLIVVAVIMAMVIIAGIVCYIKKDALLRAGSDALIGSIKVELMQNPVEGVDTVQVNRIADAFVQNMAATKVDMERYGHFAQQLSGMMEDDRISADEADQFVQSMIDYFPDLEKLRRVPEKPAETAPTDSVQ